MLFTTDPGPASRRVLFEYEGCGCDLRVELALDDGSECPAFETLLDLVSRVLSTPAGPIADPPAEPAPEPVVNDSAELARSIAATISPKPAPSSEGPESEPTTFTVDAPAPSSSNGSSNGSSSSPSAEILALLADAGGEFSDAEGRVAAQLRDITGLADRAVSNALTRLKERGLILTVTTGRRTSRVTLTLAGWEAAGAPAPMDAPAGSADHHQRMRDRAAGAVFESRLP